MMIKVCGITNVEDAQAAGLAGATAIGFNFYLKSPRYISVDEAVNISEKIPPGVLKVGVFVDSPPDTLRSIADAVKLDIVQLHGNESPGEWPVGMRVWKAFRVGEGGLPDSLDDFDVDAVLLDGPSPGAGRSWDWSRISGVRQRLILAGGLDAANVGEAIRAVRPWGVDACSRIESAPGRKDHEKMRRFIAAALAEN